jgi:hypothetical protein
MARARGASPPLRDRRCGRASGVFAPRATFIDDGKCTVGLARHRRARFGEVLGGAVAGDAVGVTHDLLRGRSGHHRRRGRLCRIPRTSGPFPLGREPDVSSAARSRHGCLRSSRARDCHRGWPDATPPKPSSRGGPPELRQASPPSARGAPAPPRHADRKRQSISRARAYLSAGVVRDALRSSAVHRARTAGFRKCSPRWATCSLAGSAARTMSRLTRSNLVEGPFAMRAPNRALRHDALKPGLQVLRWHETEFTSCSGRAR